MIHEKKKNIIFIIIIGGSSSKSNDFIIFLLKILYFVISLIYKLSSPSKLAVRLNLRSNVRRSPYVFGTTQRCLISHRSAILAEAEELLHNAPSLEQFERGGGGGREGGGREVGSVAVR